MLKHRAGEDEVNPANEKLDEQCVGKTVVLARVNVALEGVGNDKFEIRFSDGSYVEVYARGDYGPHLVFNCGTVASEFSDEQKLANFRAARERADLVTRELLDELAEAVGHERFIPDLPRYRTWLDAIKAVKELRQDRDGVLEHIKRVNAEHAAERAANALHGPVEMAQWRRVIDVIDTKLTHLRRTMLRLAALSGMSKVELTERLRNIREMSDEELWDDSV